MTNPTKRVLLVFLVAALAAASVILTLLLVQSGKTVISSDTVIEGDYAVAQGNVLILANGAKLTVTGNFTIDGSLLCDGGPIQLFVGGTLRVNRHVQCDIPQDTAEGEPGNGILIVARGVDFSPNAVVVSNGNVQLVASQDQLALTREAVDKLYDEAGTWTRDKEHVGPFLPFNEIPQGVQGLPEAALPSVSQEQYVEADPVLFVSTAFAQEAVPATDIGGNAVPNTWRVGGKWYVGANPANPPPFELKIPTPPPGIEKIVLNFNFGNNEVQIVDFDLTGPDGRPGKAGEASCNSQGGKGSDAMRFNARATGKIVVNNFTIHLGAGGEGGRAETSKDCDPGTATGGEGGKSGNMKIISDAGIEIRGAFNIYPGVGGAGGEAVGHGRLGKDGCDGEKGGDAVGTGGKGADNKKGLLVSGEVAGTDNVTIHAIHGGNGGKGTANGGNGGNGTGPGCNGGPGGKATANGGKGGDAQSVRAESFGGNGGDADANPGKGGNGGQGSETEPGGNGGNGGDAEASEGNGGIGTTANGEQGTVTNEKGGDGGNGGDGCNEGVGGNGGDGNPQGNRGTDGKNLCPPGTVAPPDTGTMPPPPPPAVDSFFDVFFAPPVLNFTHRIGNSPCPQQVGSVRMTGEGDLPNGTHIFVVQSSIPQWLQVSPVDPSSVNFQFNCNITSFESQTLTATVGLQAQDGSGKVLEQGTVKVTGNIQAQQ